MKGRSIVPVVKKMWEGPVRGPLAWLSRDWPTEDLAQWGAAEAILLLTGEASGDLQLMASLQDPTVDDQRRLLHHIIITANEADLTAGAGGEGWWAGSAQPPTPSGPPRTPAASRGGQAPGDGGAETQAELGKGRGEHQGIGWGVGWGGGGSIGCGGGHPGGQSWYAHWCVQEIWPPGYVQLFRDLCAQAFVPWGSSFVRLCQNVLATPHTDRLQNAIKDALKQEKSLAKLAPSSYSQCRPLHHGPDPLPAEVRGPLEEPQHCVPLLWHAGSLCMGLPWSEGPVWWLPP